MGVDHGGFDVSVAKKFLDGPNVVSVLEEVGRKAMAEGVATGGFPDSGLGDGLFDRPLEGPRVDVVPLLATRPGIDRSTR